MRFHLHAPFDPELSRASIKETPANEPLFKQLAELAAASLHAIRNMNLLTGEFLGVLPNLGDDITPRMSPSERPLSRRCRISHLTPTHSKSHGPAKKLRQGTSTIKGLGRQSKSEWAIDYRKTPTPQDSCQD